MLFDVLHCEAAIRIVVKLNTKDNQYLLKQLKKNLERFRDIIYTNRVDQKRDYDENKKRSKMVV